MLGHSFLSVLLNILILIGIGLIIQVADKGLKGEISYEGLLSLVGLTLLTYMPSLGILLALGLATYFLIKLPYPYKLGSGAFLIALLLTAIINHAVILIKI